MKHTIVPTAVGAEFDAFLYATISAERDDEPLSVLSALARRDLDPWDEAARLARLPLEAATLSLATIIPARSESSPLRSDASATAAQLIALLPRHSTNRPAPTAADQVAAMDPTAISMRRYLVLYVAITALSLFSHWMFAPPQSVSGAAPSAVPTATVAPLAAGPKAN